MKININNTIIETDFIYMITPITNVETYSIIYFDICFIKNISNFRVSIDTNCTLFPSIVMDLFYEIEYGDIKKRVKTINEGKNIIKNSEEYKIAINTIKTIKNSIANIANKNLTIPEFNTIEKNEYEIIIYLTK